MGCVYRLKKTSAQPKFTLDGFFFKVDLKEWAICGPELTSAVCLTEKKNKKVFPPRMIL